MTSTVTVKQNINTPLYVTVQYSGTTPTPYNLSGQTVWFTVKPNTDSDPTNAQAVIVKTITSHTVPASGTTVIPISGADTVNLSCKTYVYDIQVGATLADRKVTDVGWFVVEKVVKL